MEVIGGVDGCSGWVREMGCDHVCLCVLQDGCDLVCRTRSSRRIEYVSLESCDVLKDDDLCVYLCVQKEPTFGTDTDEEDEDKDDNLLPM